MHAWQDWPPTPLYKLMYIIHASERHYIPLLVNSNIALVLLSFFFFCTNSCSCLAGNRNRVDPRYIPKK